MTAKRIQLSLALATVAVLSALSGSAAEPHRLIAVLPLDVRDTGGKMDVAAQHSLEEMLRDVATDALTSAGWTVLTGETTLQVLADNGVDPLKCGDQNCHLSMAREIKAEKFLSGAVQYVDGQFTASIRLIDTPTGRILASERVEGTSVTTLRKAFEAKAGEFFAKGGMIERPAAPAIVTQAPAPAPATPSPQATVGRLKIVSEPSGAVVSLDGEPAGTTPLKKQVDPGTYHVKLTLTGYAGREKDIVVEPSRESYDLETLEAIPPPSEGEPQAAAVLRDQPTFRATGLEWQRVPSAPMQWSLAAPYCAKLQLAGGRWRLPTKEELTGLLQARSSSAEIASYPGMTVTPGVTGYFWSSSPYAPSSSAWVVVFDYGSSYGPDPGAAIPVRCVR